MIKKTKNLGDFTKKYVSALIYLGSNIHAFQLSLPYLNKRVHWTTE